MASGRSCTCYASVSFIISIVLAATATSLAVHTHSKNSTPLTIAPEPINHDLSLNISKTLRRAGFNDMATIFLLSPEIFLSHPNSTIFAIKDSAISNTSLPPWLLKTLLQYHTSIPNLSMDELLNKPKGSCLPTLFPQKNVAITKVDKKERFLEINHVLVTNSDVFLGETIAIHGVLAPFSSVNPQDLLHHRETIHSPFCYSNFTLVSDVHHEPRIKWNQILRFLSSNGFVSFAIGLRFVLHKNPRHYKGLDSATILAPPCLSQFLSSPSPVLDRAVRLHILPLRLTFKELSSLPVRTQLKTLVNDEDVEITRGSDGDRGPVINGREIVSPDVFVSDKIVIHGISGVLYKAQFPFSS